MARAWKEFLCFISWEIWKLRNRVTFDFVIKSTMQVSNRAIGCFKEYNLEKLVKRKRNIEAPLVSSFQVTRYFDGASQEDGHVCGAEGIICLVLILVLNSN